VTFSCIETDQVALKFQMSAPLLGNGMPQNMAQQQIQSRQPGMHDLQQMIMVSIFLALSYSMIFANIFSIHSVQTFCAKTRKSKSLPMSSKIS
jgi:nucleoside recognition membrane protein YjiH